MSHSFLKFVAVPSACFVLIVIGFPQLSPVDAGTSEQPAIDGEARAKPFAQSQTAAGKLIVDAIAAFDVNSLQPAVFGDSEPTPAVNNKVSR